MPEFTVANTLTYLKTNVTEIHTNLTKQRPTAG